MKRCHVSGKIRFEDSVSAYLRISSSPWALKQRAYLCPHCECWHLTKSHPKQHYRVTA